MRLAKCLLVGWAFIAPAGLNAATSTILGWNNLGMHCMDSDYSVFSVLPPYNTIEGQLIVNGSLVTNGTGYRVTYQAVADPAGSFNSTSEGKGNFYTYAASLYGASLAPNQGLAGWSMPGLNNAAQEMRFETTNVPAAGVATKVNWFRAEGIPITPYDDAGHKNPYPMMRMIAWNGTQAIATNDVVLPVSDEMDCRACHASGTQAAAAPGAGWVWDGLPERDYRLNILRLHDEYQFAGHGDLYRAALAARGFNPQGLYRSVTADGKPVLCAACHASEALGAPSYSTIPQLTTSVHSFHAHVKDPVLNTTLDNAQNRAACYRCHPGSTTKCLRGAMGGAVAADGSMEMQCQSCHGNMSQVGASTRVGWFMEPNCQSCHTGNATNNMGQIRFTSAFDSTGAVRVATNLTFATSVDTPAAGLSLYRFSVGHGGLQCSACHGSTHAEFPSTHANDNVRNVALQGHVGMMVECTACHVTMPNTPNRGPHGMHAIGQGWVSGSDTVIKHADQLGALGGPESCKACHGSDYRGTVLSRAQATRTITASFDGGTVTVNLFRGAQVGCYNCHNGPSSDGINTSAAPVVSNVSTNTSNDQVAVMPLSGTGANLQWQIVSQPANGTVGLTNGVAVYFPNPGFVGNDGFTFAAYNGSKNSNVGTGTVSVGQGTFSLGATAYVPPSYPASWPVAFNVVPVVTNNTGTVTVDWDFGDGSAHSAETGPTHSYAQPGSYSWAVAVSLGGTSVTRSGTITITAPVVVQAAALGSSLTVSWPQTAADTILESSPSLGASAKWSVVTNIPAASGGMLSVTLPVSDSQFLRTLRPW